MNEDYKLPIKEVSLEPSLLDKAKAGLRWAATKDLADYLPFRLSSGNNLQQIPLDQFERQYGVGEKRADLESLGLKAKPTPFYKRSWFKNSMFWGRRLAFLSSAAAIALVLNYSNENKADLANQFASQKAGLENYLESPEFDRFTQDIERRSLWTMNFIAKEPITAHQILPEVAKAEQEKGELDWSIYVMPISQSDYSRPKLIEQQRKISALLANRGYKFDTASRIGGRNVIFNQAVASMNDYLKQHPSDQFPLITRNQELQDMFMKAVAKKFSSGNQYDIERLGSLYKVFGNAMYEDQKTSVARSKSLFTSIK